jgi:hypothetical protein
MSEAVIENATKAIPSVIHMISGCRDEEQTSADVSNVQSFSLPNPQGRAGGALTAALLNVAYADHKKNTGKDLSFEATLLQVREMLRKKGFSQIPQLSSSRPMDISAPFDIVPENMTGTRRAIMMWVFSLQASKSLLFHQTLTTYYSSVPYHPVELTTQENKANFVDATMTFWM